MIEVPLYCPENDFETLDEDKNGRVSLEEVIAGAQVISPPRLRAPYAV